MSNIFDKLKKIDDFKIIKSVHRIVADSNEPDNGIIFYNGERLFFKFNHEFDSGNTYLVYKNNTPIYYFLLYFDPDGDINSPMIRFEK